VLVDPRLVGEGVAADDRLVPLDGHPGDRAEHAAHRVEPLGLDAGGQAEVVVAGLDGHHDLLERGVAGAFADAVDGTLDLPGAGLDAGQAVGDGQAQVVMTVNADDGLRDVRHPLRERADDLRELGRHGVADGVGDVHRGGAGLDSGLDDVAEEVDLGARGVLGAELDVVAIRLCTFHAHDGPLDDLLAGHLQLVLAVDGRGGQEHVDARLQRELEGLPGAVDVAVAAPGQATHGRPDDLGGDGADGVEVAL
jgi:hypothetical protein